jgi:hypothetical protein
MPETEGRAPAFYDHETEEPRATGRRRRQVADWGVGEDAFDRLPSRRFERRGEERRHAARHEDFATRDDSPARSQRFERGNDAAATPHREVSADWLEEAAARDHATADWLAETATHDDAAADWLDEPEPAEDPPADEDGHRTIEGALAPSDEHRTIVIGGAVEREFPPDDAPQTPRPRRTIVIGGHPDGLPVVRQRRPPPTAMERVGARPDRFVAYSVAMGFLLILLAILTTGH